MQRLTVTKDGFMSIKFSPPAMVIFSTAERKLIFKCFVQGHKLTRDT